MADGTATMLHARGVCHGDEPATARGHGNTLFATLIRRDASLGLIESKQRQAGLAPAGVALDDRSSLIACALDAAANVERI